METSLSQLALSRIELCYNTVSGSKRLVTTLHNIDDHCISLLGKGSCFVRLITERQHPSPTTKHKYGKTQININTGVLRSVSNVDTTHLC